LFLGREYFWVVFQQVLLFWGGGGTDNDRVISPVIKCQGFDASTGFRRGFLITGVAIVTGWFQDGRLSFSPVEVHW
jgi:hypothetical protein